MLEYTIAALCMAALLAVGGNSAAPAQPAAAATAQADTATAQIMQQAENQAVTAWQVTYSTVPGSDVQDEPSLLTGRDAQGNVLVSYGRTEDGAWYLAGRNTYDAAGHLARTVQWNADGSVLQQSDYTYNAQGDAVTAQSGLQTVKYTYVYDGKGRATRVQADTYVTGSDALAGQIITETVYTDLPDGGWQAKVTDTDTQSGEQSVRYETYDAAGRLTEQRMENGGAYVTRFSYDAQGRETEVQEILDGAVTRRIETAYGPDGLDTRTCEYGPDGTLRSQTDIRQIALPGTES